MFAASDDENEPQQAGSAQRSANPRNVVAPHDVPSSLKFLQQSCHCQLKVCLQQFLDNVGAVEAKRVEFKSLPNHEKDDTGEQNACVQTQTKRFCLSKVL